MMVFPGIRFDRPSFIQMMNEVKVGNIGTIIIKDMSRLGRDYLSVYNRVVQAILQKGKVIYGEERKCTCTYEMDV